ncbi:uncharacterized protein il11a [Betta splendens]|uniref:Uncharacterized protein il11a n=1 Tax=Betta splendens TaxID=158456 RepID=A0A6P7KR39_BETSP|nr:uncharacterized protein il11a [Betta splendens]
MKLLLDSSSSLLFSLLLAQLPVFTSGSPVPQRRTTEMDKLSNQTKNLLKLTQELLKDHAFEADVEPHRFRSLPEMSNRSANDLNNLELKPTLSQLHSDLKLYEHHFEWLNRVSKKHHHPAVPKLVEMIREIKSLISLLHRQMKFVKVETPRLTPVAPSLPPHLPYHFDVLQSSHELLQHFKLFCDWAYRAFISLKPKVTATAVQ